MGMLHEMLDGLGDMYERARPADPRDLANEAMARMSARATTAADEYVHRLGVRAARRALGDCVGARVDDVRRAVEAVAVAAPYGSPERVGEMAALDAYVEADDDLAVLLCTRRNVQRASRACSDAYQMGCATGASAALARIAEHEAARVTVHGDER